MAPFFIDEEKFNVIMRRAARKVGWAVFWGGKYLTSLHCWYNKVQSQSLDGSNLKDGPVRIDAKKMKCLLRRHNIIFIDVIYVKCLEL